VGVSDIKSGKIKKVTGEP